MAKEKKTGQLFDAETRKRLSHNLGSEQVIELEKQLIDEAEREEISFVETQARKKLRERLGEEKLSELERRIIEDRVRPQTDVE